MELGVRARATAVLVCCLLSGCWRAADIRERELLTSVRTRAGFDFGCDENQIELVVLDTYRHYGDRPRQIGATGCGRRGAYVLVGHTWVLNNFSNEDSGSTERPVFEYSRVGDQSRGVRLTFVPGSAWIRFEFNTARSSTHAQVLIGSRNGQHIHCDRFRLGTSTTHIDVALSGNSAVISMGELLNSASQTGAQALFCDQVWVLAPADTAAFEQFRRDAQSAAQSGQASGLGR